MLLGRQCRALSGEVMTSVLVAGPIRATVLDSASSSVLGSCYG